MVPVGGLEPPHPKAGDFESHYFHFPNFLIYLQKLRIISISKGYRDCTLFLFVSLNLINARKIR